MKKIILTVLSLALVFTMVGCSEKTPDVSIKDMMSEIKNIMKEDMIAGGVKEDSFEDGNIPGFMEIDFTAEEKSPFAPENINPEDLEEGIFLGQMINIKSDMIIVLKAKDESKVEALKTELEKIHEQQKGIWETYLPDQYEKVQNTIIKTNGNYLIYITYDSPEKIEDVFDNALK